MECQGEANPKGKDYALHRKGSKEENGQTVSVHGMRERTFSQVCREDNIRVWQMFLRGMRYRYSIRKNRKPF